MTYSGLLGHVVTVYRKSQTVTSLRTVKRVFTPVVVGAAMEVQTYPERYGDARGGQMVTGRYIGFGEAGLDIREGDIVAVTDGPEGWDNFGWLKVDGVSHPRGHHPEVELSSTTEDPTA